MKKIKQIALSVVGMALIATGFVACSSDDSSSSMDESNNQITSFGQTGKVIYDDVKQDSKGWLTLGDKTYFLNENDEDGDFLTKFDGNKQFQYYITSNFEVDYSEEGQDIIVTELKSGDQLTITNYVEENGSFVFDVKAGDRLFESVRYSKNSNYHPGDNDFVTIKACIPCIGVAIAVVIEAIADAFDDSDCETAIKQCREAGGLPQTEIEEGFFSNSCKVKCLPKPKETRKVRFAGELNL